MLCTRAERLAWAEAMTGGAAYSPLGLGPAHLHPLTHPRFQQEYYANTGALKRAAEVAKGPSGGRVGCSIVEAFAGGAGAGAGGCRRGEHDGAPHDE